MVMMHFKKADSGIVFIGYDDEQKIYSTDYYANVGICNANASQSTTLRAVNAARIKVVEAGYKQVTYLKHPEM